MEQIEDNLGDLACEDSRKVLGLIGRANVSRVVKSGSAIILLVLLLAIISWQFAFFTLLWITAHKYGHIWAMRHCGMKTENLYPLPFLSSTVATEEAVISREDEYYIALMGALWGALIIFLVLVIFKWTGERIYFNVAADLIFINLINLLPLGILDGGRMLMAIVISIHRKAGMITRALIIVALGLLGYKTGITPFFLLILPEALGLIGEIYYYKEQIERDALAIDLLETSGSADPMSKLRIFVSSCVYFFLFASFLFAWTYMLLMSLSKTVKLLGITYMV